MIHDHCSQCEEFEIIITIGSGSVVWHYLEILIQLFHFCEISFNEFCIKRCTSEKLIAIGDEYRSFFVQKCFKIMWFEEVTLREII